MSPVTGRRPERGQHEEKAMQEAMRKLRENEAKTGKQAKPTTGEKLRDAYRENA